jgi:cell division protein FtsB
MTTVPSIKGSVFLGQFDFLTKLVEAGEISRSELERRLLPEDLALFDTPIQVTAWYDIRTYARILELLRDVAGGGSNEFLVERGAASAERLLYSGMYPQFDYLKRTQMQAASTPRDRYLAFGRDLRLLITLNDSVLNFSRGGVQADPDHDDRWMLVTSDARDYPEVLCWTTLGFDNRMAQEHGCPGLWRWERPRPDLIYFRMNYAV